MNGSDACYKELNCESTFLYDYCNKFVDKLNPKDDMFLYRSFKILPLQKSIWSKEPLLSKIDEKFPFLFCGVQYFPPNVVYDYHSDGLTRYLAINMLLKDDVSHSLFKGNLLSDGKDHKNQEYIESFEITELKYKPKKFYLYNVMVEHSVITLNKPRFTLGVDFKDSKLPYEEVYYWCKENNMLESEQSK